MARTSRTRNVLTRWFPFALGITLIAGAAYFFVPRFAGASSTATLSSRAQQIASELDAGKQAQDFLSGEEIVDINQAGSSYVLITDQTGKTIASSATFNGQVLSMPAGMFTFVSEQGWDGAEWQPAPGVRQELSLRKFQSGYVVVGRKAASADDADPGLRRMVIALWGAGLAAALGLVAFKPVRLRTA